MADDFGRAAAKLRGLGPTIEGVLPRAVAAGAKIIRAEVEARAPVDDGDLKRSIGDRPVSGGLNQASHQTHVSIFYARYVEYGHGGPHPAPAHPFFRPACDHKAAEAAERVIAVILEASRSVTS